MSLNQLAKDAMSYGDYASKRCIWINRFKPHIAWDAYAHRYMFMVSNCHFFTKDDVAAQNYVYQLNRTKQAHPVK